MTEKMILQNVELTNDLLNLWSKLEVWHKKLSNFYETNSTESFELYQIINMILFEILSTKKRNVFSNL